MFGARFTPGDGLAPAKRPKEKKVKHRKTLKRKREDDLEETSEKDVSANDVPSSSDGPLQEVQPKDEAVAEAETDLMDVDGGSDVEKYQKTHSAVLERFQKTMATQDGIEPAKEVEHVDFKDVAPMPQPALPKDKNLSSLEAKNQNLDWLSKPEYHATDVIKSFKELEPPLADQIVENLDKAFGIKDAFSVQVNVIESVLKDAKKNELNPKPFGDYLVNAATGSGKTLAYLIPVVQSLIGRTVPVLRCIILAPTKPLVTQVYNTLETLAKGTGLVSMMLKTDESLDTVHEKYARVNPDIIVTAPGRLVDLVTSYKVDLSQLHYLIVDEADRLLNQSYQNWCDILVSAIEKDQQLDPLDSYSRFKVRCIKMILSATLTTNSEKLSHLRLLKPKVLVVNDANRLVNELYQLPPRLDEYMMRVPDSLNIYKPLILLHLLMSKPDWQTHGLVFVRSNDAAIKLARLSQILIDQGLATGLDVFSVDSTMDNREKRKMLRKFDDDGGILVATDLVSRGLNFDSIRLVVNYDAPLSTKEYIHRVGRTARAGKQGEAITMCFGGGEAAWFHKLASGTIDRNGKTVIPIDFVKESDPAAQNPELVVDMDTDVRQRYRKALDEMEAEARR